MSDSFVKEKAASHIKQIIFCHFVKTSKVDLRMVTNALKCGKIPVI